MNPHYPLIAERAGHRCEYCRAPEAVFNLPFEVEHIVPVSKGGADDHSNHALGCRACNLHKSDHLDGTDRESGLTVSLFHPRRDVWDLHFRIDAPSGRIEGRTPVGRATVDRLQINSTQQMASRRQWLRLGLFP